MINTIRTAIDYYFLSNKNANLYSILTKLRPPYDKLFLRFMRLKRINIKFISNFNVKFMSFGTNCYSHSMMIWLGFKLPRYISNKKRLAFDLGITNIKNICYVLNNPSELKCDSVSEDNKYFISKKLDFRFNHDFINNELSYQQNLNNINEILQKRISSNIIELSNGNCLCVIVPDSLTAYGEIEALFATIKNFNNSNKIVIIDSMNYMNKYNEQYYCNVKFPFDKYIWFYNKHFISDDGFQYFNNISIFLRKFIKNNFEISVNNKIDPFIETLNRNELNSILRLS